MSEEHQGLPVAGYLPQTSFKVNLVNRNKEAEERVLRLLEEVETAMSADRRWSAIARNHIEQGFMALNRAIFQPARIRLPEDPG